MLNQWKDRKGQEGYEKKSKEHFLARCHSWKELREKYSFPWWSPGWVKTPTKSNRSLHQNSRKTAALFMIIEIYWRTQSSFVLYFGWHWYFRTHSMAFWDPFLVPPFLSRGQWRITSFGLIPLPLPNCFQNMNLCRQSRSPWNLMITIKAIMTSRWG